MAKRKTLKKNINYICSELFAECVALTHYKVDIKQEERFAQVIVPDDQLSLAIGKSGQNARLAAKLTNWKIDIKSETQFRQMLEEAQSSDQEEKTEEFY
mgnify:CR=1 FL=1